MAGYQGWAALGEALGGGSTARRQDSYIKGVREGAGADNALQIAASNRAKRITEELKAASREKIAAAYRASAIARGLPPEAAELGAMFAQGGNMNFGSFMAGDEQLSDRELDRQRIVALGEGKGELANQLVAVQNEKNYEPVRALGGAYVPSGVALGDSGFKAVPTPTAAASIANGRARTQAAVAKALRPPAARSGGGRSSTPNPDNAALAEAREAIAAGANPTDVKARLRARGYSKVAAKL